MSELRGRIYGAVASTGLHPHMIGSEVRLLATASPSPSYLSESVRNLRQLFLQLQYPSPQPVRPKAELKWLAELGLHNFGLLPYTEAKQHNQDSMLKLAREKEPTRIRAWSPSSR